MKVGRVALASCQVHSSFKPFSVAYVNSIYINGRKDRTESHVYIDIDIDR